MQTHRHKIAAARPFVLRVRFADASLPATISFAASTLCRLTSGEQAVRLWLSLNQAGG